jgi:hypothetical protein
MALRLCTKYDQFLKNVVDDVFAALTIMKKVLARP